MISRVKTGRYVIAESIAVSEVLTDFLIYADMLVNRSSYQPFSELQNIVGLFDS